MEELRKYKIAALIGIIVMGIGAFMACLCTTSSLIMTGNVSVPHRGSVSFLFTVQKILLRIWEYFSIEVLIYSRI